MSAVDWFCERGWVYFAIAVLLTGALLGDLVWALDRHHSVWHWLLDSGLDAALAGLLAARVREALRRPPEGSSDYLELGPR